MMTALLWEGEALGRLLQSGFESEGKKTPQEPANNKKHHLILQQPMYLFVR